MTVRRTIATTVLASFLAGLVPAPSFAATDTSATAPARQADSKAIGLREAAQKAVAQLVKQDAIRATPAATNGTRTSRRAQKAGGGGGSKVLPIVLTLVGVAASVGATYYAVKALKKDTPTTAGQ